MTSANEKRKHPRAALSIESLLLSADLGVQNRVINVSRNGVLCATREPVPEMTMVEMELELPDSADGAVTLRGTVVRCEPNLHEEDEFLIAIFMAQLDDGALGAIDRYVRSSGASNGG